RRRKEVERVLEQTLAPASALPGAERRAPLSNISLGLRLADYPLVHAALGLIALAAGEVDFALASRLLRSPFIAGAESELARRARLDADLRDVLPARVTLAKIV